MHLEKGKGDPRTYGATQKFWFVAVDKDSFKELLDKAHTLIEGLRNLLNDIQQAASWEDILLLQLQNITLAS